MKDLLSKKDRDLKDAIEAMERLRGSEAEKLKLVLDQRFAGLSLTGENVVFLVDTSGSMDLVDENTPSAEKWPVVRETLVRLMNSMLNLKKFQVVTFSEDIAFPLGRAGQWIDFDPKKSGDQVREALARIKPSGGTNLHKAFEATFKMRQDGLDTVYLLSDGLPSDGEGLTPEQDRATLKDLPLRAQLITRHLRKRLREEWNKPGPKQERVRINSVGFFYESPDVGAFLWALSREHDGSFVGMSKP